MTLVFGQSIHLILQIHYKISTKYMLINSSDETKSININSIRLSNIKCSIYSTRGKKNRMEDNYIIESDDEIFLAGIFDGHNGELISKS